MTDRHSRAGDAESIVARLDTLLDFDRGAAAAYREAAERMGSDSLRRSARHFCDDHERHVDELTRLRRAHGGGHVPPPPPSAHAEVAAEIAGMTSDRAMLRALKTLARSGRDSYRAAVKEHLPPEVAAVLRRASNDETTHYAWALEMLDDLESDRGRLRRTVAVALDQGGARLNGFVAVVERGSTSVVERMREGIYAALGAHPMRAAIFAVGVGICAGALGRDPSQAQGAAGGAR